MWTALLLILPARAGCDRASLRSAVAMAEASFESLDLIGLQQSADEAGRVLGCLEDPVDAVEAATYHRIKALVAFSASDHALAISAFQAARFAWPAVTLPTSWGGPGHPLRMDWELAGELPPGETLPVPIPATGFTVVDGARGAAFPTTRPYVFQKGGEAGQVDLSAWMPAGRPPPPYDLKVAPVAMVPPADAVTPEPGPTALAPPPPRSERVQRGLIAGGLAVGMAGAAALGGAWVARGDYNDAIAGGTPNQIERSYRWTNALSVTSGVLAGGGALCVVGGLL